MRVDAILRPCIPFQRFGNVVYLHGTVPTRFKHLCAIIMGDSLNIFQNRFCPRDRGQEGEIARNFAFFVRTW